jgi:murein DD-endopeptidase MepM/ murein hydrolase activator NlpD
MIQRSRNASPMWIHLILVSMLFIPQGISLGQTLQADSPYYVVREGDSLWGIAAAFGVTVGDLQQTNSLADADQLAPGMKILIPGLVGYSGEVNTVNVRYGETLNSLSWRFSMPESVLVQLNRLTSPNQLYAGASFIVPSGDRNQLASGGVRLKPGQSLFELAVINGVTPWDLAAANGLPGTWAALPDDPYAIPGISGSELTALPVEIESIEVDPIPLAQGRTTLVRMVALPGVRLSGSLGDKALTFFPVENGYAALQGVGAQQTPGLYPLSLTVSFPTDEGKAKPDFTFSQSVLVLAGDFANDPALNVDPATLDPKVTQPEDRQWAALGQPVTGQKYWEGRFQSPVPGELKDCWTSLFGNRRVYNGGVYRSYHSGLDFCGTMGTQLYAPATGRVVFTGALTVRGKVTVIDHGWGVYTAYDHQSEILVRPGETVTPGQLIGLGGATGRTTGPHLHWEVWVGGVPVNPIDWLQHSYP